MLPVKSNQYGVGKLEACSVNSKQQLLVLIYSSSLYVSDTNRIYFTPYFFVLFIIKEIRFVDIPKILIGNKERYDSFNYK